jgi:hypothetical protein
MMQSRFDIAAYSPNRQLVLLAEVKWLKEASEENAIFFRRNLINNKLLPRIPYFLIAYRNALYLWKESTAADSPPDFKAAAKPVLKKYLGTVAENDPGPGPEGMETAVKLWLSDLASGVEDPDPQSAADKMLVDSGLYDQLKFGEVGRDVH